MPVVRTTVIGLVLCLAAAVFAEDNPSMPGGRVSIDVADPGVAKAAEFALKVLSAKSPSLPPFRLINIKQAEYQVVAVCPAGLLALC